MGLYRLKSETWSKKGWATVERKRRGGRAKRGKKGRDGGHHLPACPGRHETRDKPRQGAALVWYKGVRVAFFVLLVQGWRLPSSPPVGLSYDRKADKSRK